MHNFRHIWGIAILSAVLNTFSECHETKVIDNGDVHVSATHDSLLLFAETRNRQISGVFARVLNKVFLVLKVILVSAPLLA